MYLHRLHSGLGHKDTGQKTVRIETEIKKWGNTLALRVTGMMAEAPQFEEGTKVTVDVSPEGIVVKPAVKRAARLGLPYSESALLKEITPAKAHADALANPLDVETGIPHNDGHPE